MRKMLDLRFLKSVFHGHVELVIVGQARVVSVAVIWDFVIVVIIKTDRLGVGDAGIEIPVYLGCEALRDVVYGHQVHAVRDAVVGDVFFFV